MANENWKPDLNQQVPNGPVKTYPWLTTITPDNPSGYIKLYPTATNGSKKLEYAVETGGVISWRVVDDQGFVRRQFNSLQQLADSGYNFGFDINATNINKIKNALSVDLKSLNEDIKSGDKNPSPYFTGQIPGRIIQPPPPENAPGANPNQDTGGQSGSGNPSPSTAGSPTTFGVTSENFQTDGKYNNEFLKYPEKMNSGQDRIVIVQRRYETPDVLSGGELSLDKIRNGAFSAERSFTRTLGTAVLPMPNDISETNVTAWGEDSLSSLAALVGSAALGAAGGIADFNMEQIQRSMEEAAKGVFSGPGAETIRQLLTLNAAAAITQKFGININPEAFRSRITGTAINPNLELLFQGPKLRSFGFQFKMTPRSEEEARNIRYILKFFKKGMAPKRAGGDAAYFLGAPNVFDIYFRSNEGTAESLKSIGKIKTCALQQCAINYTPDGFYSAFKDQKAGGSQPISVVMQLAFTELTPLYNDNYDEKTDDNVGFDSLKFKSEEGETETGGGDVSPPGPDRGGTSGPASPTRPFQPGGPTNNPGLDFDPNRPGNAPVLGPGGVQGV
jgi:hypothetical protein